MAMLLYHLMISFERKKQPSFNIPDTLFMKEAAIQTHNDINWLHLTFSRKKSRLADRKGGKKLHLRVR